jgi:hypothetical protein
MLFATRMCPVGTPAITAEYPVGLVDDLLRGAAAGPGPSGG